MGTALIVVASVLGLLVMLLAVPVDVAFWIRGIEPFDGQASFRWLFGLVRYRVHLPGFPGLPPLRAGARQQVARPRGDRGRVLTVLREAAFRRRVVRFAEDLVRAAQLHELRLRLRLGLGDPADTGRLWALLGPLSVAAQQMRNTELRIEPEFMEAVVEFEAHGRLMLIPLRILTLVLAFALSPASVRAWRTLGGSHA